jgi:hypothetical protein
VCVYVCVCVCVCVPSAGAQGSRHRSLWGRQGGSQKAARCDKSQAWAPPQRRTLLLQLLQLAVVAAVAACQAWWPQRHKAFPRAQRRGSPGWGVGGVLLQLLQLLQLLLQLVWGGRVSPAAAGGALSLCLALCPLRH